MKGVRFPSPPADRRQSTRPSRQRRGMTSTMAEMMNRQIQQLRQSLAEYSVVSTRSVQSLDYSVLPNHVNIMIFGPSGSGKSSLIRTMYRALHNSPNLPGEIKHKVVVKGTARNEGTTLFSTVVMKEENSAMSLSGIKVHDTRGQIWMDDKEQAQVDLVMSGKVKDMSKVDQRNHRYAHLLWEFWKKDSELFPTEIIKPKPTLADKPHCLLFVFDGSLDEVPNGEEETLFYKEILSLARNKGYFYPQVILTHIDKVEESISENSEDGEARLREMLDLKIESIVMKLGIPRSSVHFIENYHERQREPEINIDFHVLRLLHESVQQADSFLTSQLKERSMCDIF
jgi:energy-coupling factor transporter ATP-binding protein EcfA2